MKRTQHPAWLKHSCSSYSDLLKPTMRLVLAESVCELTDEMFDLASGIMCGLPDWIKYRLPKDDFTPYDTEFFRAFTASFISIGTKFSGQEPISLGSVAEEMAFVITVAEALNDYEDEYPTLSDRYKAIESFHDFVFEVVETPAVLDMYLDLSDCAEINRAAAAWLLSIRTSWFAPFNAKSTASIYGHLRSGCAHRNFEDLYVLDNDLLELRLTPVADKPTSFDSNLIDDEWNLPKALAAADLLFKRRDELVMDINDLSVMEQAEDDLFWFHTEATDSELRDAQFVLAAARTQNADEASTIATQWANDLSCENLFKMERAASSPLARYGMGMLRLYDPERRRRIATLAARAAGVKQNRDF